MTKQMVHLEVNIWTSPAVTTAHPVSYSHYRHTLFISLTQSHSYSCPLYRIRSALYSTVYFIQQSASYNRLLHTTDCFIQQTASYNSLLHTTVCLIQQSSLYKSASYNRLPYTTVCFIQQTALYSSLPYTTSLLHTTVSLIQQSALYNNPRHIHATHSTPYNRDGLTDVLGSKRWSYRCAGVREMVLQMCWG